MLRIKMKTFIPKIQSKIGKRLEDFLEKEYIEERRSSADIANELNISSRTILKYLRKFNIKRRTSRETQFNHIIKPNKKELQELYLNQEKSSDELAEQFNTTGTTIRRWLKEYKIKTRAKPPDDFVKPSKRKLKSLYVEHKKSASEIAEEFDVADTTVIKWLKKYEIPLRTASESKYAHIQKLSKKQLESMYIKNKMAIYEIGKKIGVNPRRVISWLKEYKIEIRHGKNKYVDKSYRKKLIDDLLKSITKSPQELNTFDFSKVKNNRCSYKGVLNWYKTNFNCSSYIGARDKLVEDLYGINQIKTKERLESLLEKYIET